MTVKTLYTLSIMMYITICLKNIKACPLKLKPYYYIKYLHDIPIQCYKI